MCARPSRLAEELEPLPGWDVDLHERGEHGCVLRGKVIADEAGQTARLVPAVRSVATSRRSQADELKLLGAELVAAAVQRGRLEVGVAG